MTPDHDRRRVFDQSHAARSARQRASSSGLGEGGVAVGAVVGADDELSSCVATAAALVVVVGVGFINARGDDQPGGRGERGDGPDGGGEPKAFGEQPAT
jgi:hypothetical protein